MLNILKNLIMSAKIVKKYEYNDQFECPSYAEHLIKFDFVRQKEIPGKYGGNLADHSDVIYTCPKCKTEHDIKFKHGDTWKCSCGLFAQSYGNGLDVWE